MRLAKEKGNKHRYQVVGGGVDVSRRGLLRRVQRRAAAVAGREAGRLACQGPAFVFAALAPLGVIGREDARGGVGGEVAVEEAVPASGRGGPGPRGVGRTGGERAGAVEGEGWLGFGEGEEGEVRRRHEATRRRSRAAAEAELSYLLPRPFFCPPNRKKKCKKAQNMHA